MKAGILAAGEGLRLQGEGPRVLKPLCEVSGRPLIVRVLDQLIDAGADTVYVIVNEHSGEVRDRVAEFELSVPVRFVVRSTPSSMHSLLALHPFFEGGEALVSMVDSILPAGSLAPLVQRARRRRDSDATLGVTSFIDDEKPLGVRLSGDRITALGTGLPRARWVTAGIYYFTGSIWPELERANALGVQKMRSFLAHLLSEGKRLHGHRLPEAVDVDRPEDVRTAEEYLSRWERRQ